MKVLEMQYDNAAGQMHDSANSLRTVPEATTIAEYMATCQEQGYRVEMIGCTTYQGEMWALIKLRRYWIHPYSGPRELTFWRAVREVTGDALPGAAE